MDCKACSCSDFKIALENTQNRCGGRALRPEYVDAVGELARRHGLRLHVDGARLSNRRVFIACRTGETPDGFRVDVDGNLWCGWGMTPEYDGVRVFNAAGAPIGHIPLPERCANVAVGGRHRNRLFMAAAQSLYACYVNTQGVAGG